MAGSERLLREYGGERNDLSGVLVVVSGRRGGRRLLEVLVEMTGGKFSPPEIITVGDFPEKLYRAKRAFASDLVQKLAWGEAIQRLGQEKLSAVVRPGTERLDEAGWMRLGELLWKEHRELAGDGLNFADVAKRGRGVEGFGPEEAARWKVLGEVQREYLRMLDELGLWDVQTARIVAVQQRECRIDREVVLLGISDLNRIVREMLRSVAEKVHIFVHAPEEMSGRFDEFGCVEPDAWQGVEIPITDEEIRVADGPEEQVEEGALCLAELGGEYRADEIVICVADDQLFGLMERELDEFEVATRSLSGRPMRETAAYQLLEVIRRYLENEGSREFAALVRHPQVGKWLGGEVGDGWLAELDSYLTEHLVLRMGTWLGPEEKFRKIKKVWEQVREWLSPLTGAKRPVGEWSRVLGEVVLRVLEGEMWNPEEEVEGEMVAALKIVRDALEQQSEIPKSLEAKVAGSEAITMLLAQLSGQAAVSLGKEEAIEIVGWLELAMDDSPVAIVLPVNEGVIPTSLNADLFLPDRLRRELQLADNRRRYARDAYALSAIHAERSARKVTGGRKRGVLRLIAGRRDGEGAALKPSRLLLATPVEKLSERVLTLLGRRDEVVRRGLVRPGIRKEGGRGFGVARPGTSEPVMTLPVTAFRDYLACPYRFYLKQIAGLEASGDPERELSGMVFGSVLHEVLRVFGSSELRNSNSSEPIEKFLQQQLLRTAKQQFGGNRSAAVNVQLRQVELRLASFAQWQAGQVRAGWEIEHVEVSGPEGGVTCPGTGKGLVKIRGRIDRIDQNRRTGEWRVLDYKTSDRGEAPERTHLRQGEWVDLQLPLYRHLARSVIGEVGTIGLGYVVLPSQESEVGEKMAGWDESVLRSADVVAVEVIERILAGEFWPPKRDAIGFFSEFDWIVQEGVMEREAW